MGKISTPNHKIFLNFELTKTTKIMPKRQPPKMVTKHYSYPRPHSVTKPITWWEKKARERKQIDLWNEQATEYVEELSNYLLSEHKITVLVEAQSFDRLQESNQVSKFKPINYLSFEKLLVRHQGVEFLYYFGKYPSLEDLTEQVELDILNHVKERAEQRAAVAVE
jgi:hypothetical protein